jgi:heme exporter protein B
MSGGVFSGFLAVLGREWKLALRHPSDTLAAVLFFVLVAALFPFGVGPAPDTLARLAPGALLAAALLAALLPLDRLFGAEAEDGSLDQLLLSGLPRGVLAAAKALGHWLTTGVPLIAATPIAAAMLNLPVEAWGVAMVALALATALLSLLGTLGAALTLGARRGGVLLPLLVLPLAIPAVIFGAAAIEAASAGLSAAPFLLLLGAGVSLAAPLAPLAAGAALSSD